MVADSRALFVINVLWKDSHVGLNKKNKKKKQKRNSQLGGDC